MNLIWTLLIAFLQRNQNIKLLYRSEFLDHQEKENKPQKRLSTMCFHILLQGWSHGL